MKLIVTFVQIFSSLLTIISAIGFFGIPAKLQEYGVQASQLHIGIAFTVSLFLLILSIVFGNKIKGSNKARDKKSQIQVGGRNNKQKMS